MNSEAFYKQNRSIDLTTPINILIAAKKNVEEHKEENLNETDDETDGPKSFASREEFFSAMEDAYRADKFLQTKILYTTLSKIRYYTFKDEVNGQTADDVIQNVIELITISKRKWNKEKFPNVINYLLVAIHSYVRNESKKKQKWKSVDIYDNEGKLKEIEIEKFLREAIAEDLSEDFFKERLEDLIKKCMIKLEKDDNAYCVCDEILKNDTEKIEAEILAKSLGITVQEVKLAQRRIRYAANQIIKNKR